VFDDEDIDTLTGNQGLDWFFANSLSETGTALDVVAGKAASEIWDDIDV
jgi:hypothetical protein